MDRPARVQGVRGGGPRRDRLPAGSLAQPALSSEHAALPPASRAPRPGGAVPGRSAVEQPRRGSRGRGVGLPRAQPADRAGLREDWSHDGPAAACARARGAAGAAARHRGPVASSASGRRGLAGARGVHPRGAPAIGGDERAALAGLPHPRAGSPDPRGVLPAPGGAAVAARGCALGSQAVPYRGGRSNPRRRPQRAAVQAHARAAVGPEGDRRGHVPPGAHEPPAAG